MKPFNEKAYLVWEILKRMCTRVWVRTRGVARNIFFGSVVLWNDLIVPHLMLAHTLIHNANIIHSLLLRVVLREGFFLFPSARSFRVCENWVFFFWTGYFWSSSAQRFGFTFFVSFGARPLISATLSWREPKICFPFLIQKVLSLECKLCTAYLKSHKVTTKISCGYISEHVLSLFALSGQH